MLTFFMVLFAAFVAATVASAFKVRVADSGDACDPASGVSTNLPRIRLLGTGSDLGPYEIFETAPREGAGLVILVAGNPGIPGYYSDYAERLATASGMRVVVFGLVGHLTHASASILPSSERRRAFNLQQQYAHVAERLRPYCESAAEAGTPFCISGHSIGAEIAIEAAFRLRRELRGGGGDARDDECDESECVLPRQTMIVALNPYLENDQTLPSIRWKRWVARYLGPLITEPAAALFGALRASPEWVQRRVGGSALREMRAPYAELTLKGLLHPGQARNTVYLVRHEMRELNEPYALEGPAPRGAGVFAREGRLAAMFVSDDEWSPLSLIPRIRAAGGRAEHLEGSDMKHSFSVGDPAVTQRVVDWVGEQLRRGRG